MKFLLHVSLLLLARSAVATSDAGGAGLSLIQLQAEPVESAKRTTTSASTSPAITPELRTCLQQYAKRLDTVDRAFGDHIRDESYYDIRNRSDKAMVFGVGMGTTATRSLATAFMWLGLSVQHWRTGPLAEAVWDIQAQCPAKSYKLDLGRIYTGVDAVVDSPMADISIDLLLTFPKAKFVLTTRPAQDWVSDRLQRHSKAFMPLERPCSFPKLYKCNVSHAGLEEMLKAHDDLVRCAVPKDRLFEIDVFTKPTDDVLAGLAKFLGKPLPKAKHGKLITSYPGGHDTEWPEFRNVWKKKDPKHMRMFPAVFAETSHQKS